MAPRDVLGVAVRVIGVVFAALAMVNFGAAMFMSLHLYPKTPETLAHVFLGAVCYGLPAYFCFFQADMIVDVAYKR